MRKKVATPLPFVKKKKKHEIKNIIFDLYGVIFFLKSIQILKQIGLFNTFRFVLHYKKTPYQYYYVILDKMRKEVPGEYQDEIAFRGNFLPKSLCDWQRGKLSSQETLERILTFLKGLRKQNYFKGSWEYLLFDKAFDAAYTSKNRIPAMQPNKKLIQEIKQLKEQKRYKIFMLTNIDHELFNKLNEAFPEIFSLFDDITTSCHTHLIKPQKEIFEHMIHKHTFKASECLFIDDQQENITTAEQLGMHGLLYTKKSNVLSYLD